MRLRFSFCIPAYNRPEELRELLASIAVETPGDWEILVSEDHSPKRGAIIEVVEQFAREHKDLPVRLILTPRNLGYDGNLRFLVDNAEGRFCIFMGDDDIWCAGALSQCRDAADSVPEIGVILRAWQSVDKDTGEVLDVHRYFTGDRVFQPGPNTVAAFFRRSVFISGLTVATDAARAIASDRLDGTLLYQLYLVGTLLMTMPGYYVSQMTTFRRSGGEHFFGSCDKERGRFAPRQLAPQHSLNFVNGMFEIIEGLESVFGPQVGRLIRSDIARYSYPLLAIQARTCERSSFRRYASALSDLGFGKYLFFHVYRVALSVLGIQLCDALINRLKVLLGSTPVMAGSHGVRPRSTV